ncbi:3'-5' exonuclease, partial [candidate division KSB1 bacterium]
NDSIFSNIVILYNFVFKIVDKAEDKSLKAFLNYLDFFIAANGVPGKSEESEPDPGYINFLTVHASKGLEFHTVYLIGLTGRRFPTAFRKSKVTLPDDLLNMDTPKVDKRDIHISEERRLFYVALTRAENRLILSAIDKKGSRMSGFVSEICNNEISVPILNITRNPDEITGEDQINSKT